METLKRPDISPAQIVAIVGSIIAVAVAAGLDISNDLQNAIIDLVTVLAPLLILGDSVIRHGRSRALSGPPKGEVAVDDSAGGGSGA